MIDTLRIIVLLCATLQGVDPCLAQEIVYLESSWDPQAVGDDGLAVGLWQIHPESWRILCREMGAEEWADNLGLRTDPWTSSLVACWGLANGFEQWWSTYHMAHMARKGQDECGLWETTYAATKH
jgi:hypothetical protein